MEVPAALQRASVTAREAEVLDALAARLTNAEIAERLYISVRTVESHVSSLLRKLEEPDRRALATRARTLRVPAAVPLPPSLVDLCATMPFVGRVDELDAVRHFGQRALGGTRRAVLIAGEAGVGKTRLAAEAALATHAEGATVLYGRCQQGELVPYGVIADALEPLRAPGREPLIRSRGEDPSARHRLFEEVDRLLSGRGHLVVAVIDDVQWIDPSGLELLRHVLRYVDRSPLLVIATVRPEGLHGGRTLAALDGTASVDLVELRGLTRPEAERLAAALVPTDRRQVWAAWERTGGNPFLLSELIRHPVPDGTMPPTARDAVVRRVAGLGPTVVDTLTAAAVIGEAFRPDLVAAALGGDQMTATDNLDRAFRAGLVRGDPVIAGAYRFAHAIVRETLVGLTSPSRRAQLHLRVAEALERGAPSELAEIARHRHGALPVGAPDAAHRAAVLACDDAMARLAYEVAASLADLALAAIEAGGGSDDDRAESYLRRGRARIKAGDLTAGIDDCRLALEIANRLDRAGTRSEAVLAWAEASPLWGRQPDLRAALEHALAAGLDDAGRRAEIKARLAQLLYYEEPGDRRTSLIAEAIDDARSSGRPGTVAAVLAAAHAALWDPADLEARTGIARQTVDIAASIGDPELEARGSGFLAVDLLERGDHRGADAAFVRHARLAERLGQRLARRDAELWAAMRAMVRGHFDAAATHIERGRDLGEAAGDPSSDTIYWVQRYWLALERGDPNELDGVVEPCERIAADNTDVPAWRAALALLHARRGDQPAALRAYSPLAEDGFTAIPRDVVWLNAVTYLAETCAWLGDGEGSVALSAALEPHAATIALIDRGFACKGSVNRFLGLLAGTRGDRAGAEDELRRALDAHRRMGASPLVDRTARELVALG